MQYLLAKMDLPPEWIDTIQADLAPGPHDFTAKDGATRTADVRIVVEGIVAHRFYQPVGAGKQALARWAVQGHTGTVMECAETELAAHLAIEVAWLYRHSEPQPLPTHTTRSGRLRQSLQRANEKAMLGATWAWPFPFAQLALSVAADG